MGLYAVRAVTAPEAVVRAQAALNTAILLRRASPDAQVAALLQFAAGSAPAQSPLATSATYLLGRELAPHDPGAAAKALKPLAQRDGPLHPYILAAYASALDAGGHASAATDQWKKLIALDAPPQALREQAYRALAGDARGAKDRAAWLTKLVQLTAAPGDRFLLAQAAKDAGDRATFQAQLEAIITGAPGAHEAVLAVQALKTAGLPLDAGDEALVDYRHSDFTAAEQLLTSAAAAPGITPAQRTFRLYYLAASYEAQGQKARAIDTYDKAAATGADSPFVHRARYWAAEVMATTGDAKDASARYAALVKDGPAGEFTAEAAFQAGYLLLQAGDSAGAVATWQSLGPALSSNPRALYWEGRAATTAGMSAAAASAFQAAAKAAPSGFYGIEASAALTGAAFDVSFHDLRPDPTIDWDSVKTWLTKVKGPGAIPGPATAAAELAAVGLRADARQALIDQGTAADPWALLGLIREARAAGLYDASGTLASKLVSSLGLTDDDLPPAVLRLEFPLNYVESLVRAASANNIDPLFLAATIYQESAWDPEAGSSAGAMGLMQLIEPTAASVAQDHGLGSVSVADLFQPDLSIELGASFLGDQLKTFGGPALALAAYNAGPGNAARWQAGWDGVDAATLVAEMDFSETATYVENIYAWYVLYRAAYVPG
ncbi:transglycosylase SLT domain-containing protein [bacterium]|nr:transglycosylase SLT domain-containing protein [bacterium]